MAKNRRWHKVHSHGDDNFFVTLAYYYGNPKTSVVQFTFVLGARNDNGISIVNHDAMLVPCDLGYHSPVAIRDNHEEMSCNILNKGKCFYDGGCFGAIDIMKVYLTEGEGGMWRELENYWNSLFNNSEKNERE